MRKNERVYAFVPSDVWEVSSHEGVLTVVELQNGNLSVGIDKVPVDSTVQQVLADHDKHRQHVRRHQYLLKGLAYSVEADGLCWAETNPKKKINYYRSRTRVD